MATKSDIRAEARRLQSMFEGRGAQVIEADILQPADVLLDLYGEDIRGRAFVTHDAYRGETMLRPDFTVPVALSHIESGFGSATYTYSGEVFRRQEIDETRPREYVQVGFEVFGGEDAAIADAQVFAAISEALNGLPVSPVIGDIGIVSALIEDLDAPERRKAALRRHIWRPSRFRELLERFSKPIDRKILAASDAPLIGLRSDAEISDRVAALEEENETSPISGKEVERIEAVLAVRSGLSEAISQLSDLAPSGSALEGAVHVLSQRAQTFETHGLSTDCLVFEASYCRTNMEYYGGFVFGFSAAGLAVPVATGGRFDLVTYALGKAIPAVGGVVRPDLVLELGV